MTYKVILKDIKVSEKLLHKCLPYVLFYWTFRDVRWSLHWFPYRDLFANFFSVRQISIIRATRPIAQKLKNVSPRISKCVLLCFDWKSRHHDSYEIYIISCCYRARFSIRQNEVPFAWPCLGRTCNEKTGHYSEDTAKGKTYCSDHQEKNYNFANENKIPKICVYLFN